MSSLPGLDLESYVMWQHDLIVDGDGSANPSLVMAEALGTVPRRLCLTKDQFAKVLNVYEHLREDIERKLGEFDEENQSWRDYAGYAFSFVTDEIFEIGLGYVKLFESMAALDINVANIRAIIESVELVRNNKYVLIEFKDKIQPDVELDMRGVDELIAKLSAIRSQMS